MPLEFFFDLVDFIWNDPIVLLYTILICTVHNIVFNNSITSSPPPTSHSRDWHYHKEEKIWITRAPGERGEVEN